MSHTPGPWTIGPADWLISQKYGTGWRLFPIRSTQVQEDGYADGYDVATVYCDEDDAEQDANVNLIAAAPDLLEACKYMLENAESQGWSEFMLGSARAAISKAEGRA